MLKLNVWTETHQQIWLQLGMREEYSTRIAHCLADVGNIRAVFKITRLSLVGESSNVNGMIKIYFSNLCRRLYADCITKLGVYPKMC